MKAVLEIGLMDINPNLLEILRDLFQKNVSEIVVRKNTIEFKEFDHSISLDDVASSLKDYGHNTELIAEIKEGLENSSVYSGNHEN